MLLSVDELKKLDEFVGVALRYRPEYKKLDKMSQMLGVSSHRAHNNPRQKGTTKNSP